MVSESEEVAAAQPTLPFELELDFWPEGHNYDGGEGEFEVGINMGGRGDLCVSCLSPSQG